MVKLPSNAKGDSMFKPGQPIQDRDEDSLGRWPFAESLAEAILQYDSTESIAVGLYGSWGTGKTSLLNLVKKCIEEKSAKLQRKHKPVVVDFAPWHYSDQNQLIEMFFRDLSTAIKHAPGYKKGEKIAELLDDMHLYFLSLSPLTLLNPAIGLLAGAASRLSKEGAKQVRDRSSKQRTDLTELKNALDRELLRTENKVIIIIDDIDRLNSVEIRRTFQLVKSVANFKNTIYVLAFDKTVVMEALREVQKAPGQLYLEKIIPVSFDIVSPGHSDIRRELHDRLKEIIADRWDEKVWESLYEHRLRHFFSTLRDVTRFLNTFGFSYGLLRDDVRFEDLAVITAIQVHEPALYSEIYKNIYLFAGGYLRNNVASMMSDKADTEFREHLKQECEKILNQSNKIPVEQLRQVLQMTFPKIDAIYRSSATESYMRSEWRKEKRICSPEYFDRYFKLFLSADEFSQKEIDEIFSRTDAEKFLKELERLRNENRLGEFLDNLQSLDRSKLSEQQISMAMTALVHTDDIFSTVQRGKAGWAVAAQISAIVSDFSRSLDSLEQRFHVMTEAIRTAETSKGIFAIVWAIYDEHKVHEEMHLETMLPKHKLEHLIVDRPQLDELKCLVSALILERARDGRLVKEEGLPDLLYEWKRWASPEDFHAGIGLLTSEEHLSAFLASFNPLPDDILDEVLAARRSYRIEVLKGLLDINTILPRIRAIRDSPSFEALGEDKKRAIKAIIEHHDSELRSQTEGSGSSPD